MSAPASTSTDPVLLRVEDGVAWITLYFVLLVGGGNDIWATHFHLSINAITWFVRIAFFVAPVVYTIIRKLGKRIRRASRGGRTEQSSSTPGLK